MLKRVVERTAFGGEPDEPPARVGAVGLDDFGGFVGELDLRSSHAYDMTAHDDAVKTTIRNILTPNAAIEPGYRIFRVTLKDGSLLDAFFVSEDRNAMVVRQMGAADRRIERKDIASTQFLRQSLMPEGLIDALTDQQRKDLLSYLMSLK